VAAREEIDEDDGAAVTGRDDEDAEHSPRSVLYLSLASVVPLAAAVLLSKPFLGGRPLEYLSEHGYLGWIVLVAMSSIVFAASYLSTRHRYSLSYAAAAAALGCLAAYLVGHLYAHGGSSGDFSTATRWTWWLLPLALGLWTRAVFTTVDEASSSGEGVPEGRRLAVAVMTRWKGRRLLAPRTRIGHFDVVLYVVAAVLAAVALIRPYWFFDATVARGTWGSWRYEPTLLGIAAAALAALALVTLAVFGSVAWRAKPAGIALHHDARLHLVGSAAWLTALGCLVALFSDHLWPRALVDGAFAVYVFSFAVVMVHAAYTQERVRRHSTLRRRWLSGAGIVTVACAAAALAQTGSVVRAAALSALGSLAIPLASLATRSLFGFEPPPVKRDDDEVIVTDIQELEQAETAANVRALMATGRTERPLRPTLLSAVRSFVEGLQETERPSGRPREHADHGMPSSDIRRIVRGKAKDVGTLRKRVEALPALSGTLDERLRQLHELVHRTALEIRDDPRGENIDFDEPGGPPTRMDLLIAYSAYHRTFPALGDPEAQRKLRYIYRAWARAQGTWDDLLALPHEQVKTLAHDSGGTPGEPERRRRLASRHLNVAAADVRERWLSNLRAG
jgi:hypothetical protein